MLFEDRLGIEVYRPIGLEWYETGNWGIWPALDTAKQYLSLEQAYKPVDGTVQLNQFSSIEAEDGVYWCQDPSTPDRPIRACTLDYFMNNDFDYVLASIPNHVEPFRKLAARKGAKLIVQIGNEWPVSEYRNTNLLASVAPRRLPDDIHPVFYHQEFDLNAFRHEPPISQEILISSYINVYNHNPGWRDFMHLEKALEGTGIKMRSYGGQGRDGCINDSTKLGESMRTSTFIFHVKAGGDGFGHVLHNAYACGRPVISRHSHYRGQWGEELLKRSSINVDDFRSYETLATFLKFLSNDPEHMKVISNQARKAFDEVVNFDAEELKIREWLDGLR